MRGKSKKANAISERKHVQKMVDLLGELLEGKAVEGYKTIEIETENGRRKLESLALSEIYKLREAYRARLEAMTGERRKRAIIGPRFS